MKLKIFTLFAALTLSAGTLFASNTAVGGIYYYFYDANLTATVTYRGGSSAEYNNEYTGDVVIPTTVTYGGKTYSVTSIGDGAFYGCSSLTSVTIPNSVTRIGYRAFFDCSGLTSVTIPNSVTSIERETFDGCSSLTSVTIPNSVTSIGDYAFDDCSSLTSVTIGNSVTSIGSSAFGRTKLRAVTIPNSCKTIADYAFSECTRLIEINSLAERVPDIEESTFAGVSTTAMVRVPCGSIELYKASNYWNVFSNISGADRFNYSFKSNNETNGTVVIVKEPTCTDWTATIHAYPYQGYEFLGWSDGVQENPRTILVNGDIALTALFSGNNAQIDAVANNNAYGSVCGGGIYPVDETITLTATPNAGYYFVQWSDGNKDNPREITVTDNAAYTAEFALKQFTVSTDAENGTVTGAGTYAYGTKATLTATPNDGYYFVQWSDGNKDNPREVTVNQDSTFTAEFALKQFTVSTDAENGTVTGAGTYAYGTKATLTATPNDGYYFVQWSDGNKDNPREVTVNQDSTFTAEFALKQFTVSTDAENGTVTGAGTYAYGTKATLTATPNDGYYFVQWSDGNKDNPREVTVNQDSTFTAEFALKQFTVSTDAENGTVTGSGTYADGTKATLTATPNAGYYFVQWSDGNKDNPREITVTDNAAYTAEFAVCQSVEKLLQITIEKGESYIFAGKTLTAAGTYVDSLHTATGCDSVVTLVLNVHVTPQYTLKVQSENTGKGLVSGGGKYTAGTVIKVMADANEGFEFARWSDNNTENPRWITVTQNQILKAYFDTLCSVEAQVVVGSTVNANAGTIVGTGYFHCGDEVQLQATANTGYAFYRWYNAELGINNTNNPVTLQVPNGTVVTAVFKKSKKTVTTTRSASAMVSVQGRMVYVQNDEPVDVRIYDIIGRTICVANHIVDYMVELKHGAYIVCINDERVKIVIP